ncbi:MAG: SLC13 family permease [Anaerolineales bacterium]|jgi:Na+/H+ antiporter NhaD/arsenite permease-like protein
MNLFAFLAESLNSLLSVVTAENSIGLAAIIATGIFFLVFIAISFRLLHETAAALLGAVTVFLITYIGGNISADLRILTFEEAMQFVDWNVIFLILGMMIFMAILSATNVFRWLGLRLYKLSRGNTWLIAALLITLTGITSAILNDVTAILLIAPLSIQLAVALGMSPLAIVIAEVLASNIGGAATLIGDPPSTIVGSHIGMSFGEYLVNMLPIAAICMLALLVINRIQYRQEYTSERKIISPRLIDKLDSEAQIHDHHTLYKAVFLGVVTFVLFFIADYLGHMPPSVVSLSGAALLIAWVRPDVDDMLSEVDWTTLIFFIGLFVVVGGMEATGAIGWLASRILVLAGNSLTRATMLTLWISGIASGIVANIPFAVAVLPVIDLLNANIPGAAENNVLYWALIMGADFGGNSTYLGSAPNIVAVGLLAQAGYRITFSRFMRDGIPVTLITLILSSIYLLLLYL